MATLEEERLVWVHVLKGSGPRRAQGGSVTPQNLVVAKREAKQSCSFHESGRSGRKKRERGREGEKKRGREGNRIHPLYSYSSDVLPPVRPFLPIAPSAVSSSMD